MSGLLDQPISAVMEKDFVAVKKEDSLNKVIDIMVKKRLRFVPVLGDFGVVEGSITERDLQKIFDVSAATATKISDEFMISGLGRSVGEIMTPRPITLEETAPVSEAIRLFINNQIQFIPVVDKGSAIVGVLSLLDVATKTQCIAAQNEKIPEPK